jgi:hypothetical protein
VRTGNLPKISRRCKHPVKIKLAALRIVGMFLYAYADIQYFVLQPGSIKAFPGRAVGGMETTPDILFGAAVLMTINPISLTTFAKEPCKTLV